MQAFSKIPRKLVGLCLNLEQKVIEPGHLLPVTGGGSFKFERVLHDQLHVETLKQDEMESAMAGLTFLLSRPGEVCYYDTPSKKAVTFDLVQA